MLTGIGHSSSSNVPLVTLNHHDCYDGVGLMSSIVRFAVYEAGDDDRTHSFARHDRLRANNDNSTRIDGGGAGGDDNGWNSGSVGNDDGTSLMDEVKGVRVAVSQYLLSPHTPL